MAKNTSKAGTKNGVRSPMSGYTPGGSYKTPSLDGPGNTVKGMAVKSAPIESPMGGCTGAKK